jgi:hypothetical protein
MVANILSIGTGSHNFGNELFKARRSVSSIIYQRPYSCGPVIAYWEAFYTRHGISLTNGMLQ